MSTTLHLALHNTRQQGRLRWPKCCAVCAGQDGLQPAYLSSARLPTTCDNLRGGVRQQDGALQVRLPLCARHARQHALAARVLAPTPLAFGLRRVALASAVLSLLLALAWLAGDWLGAPLPHAGLPLLALGLGLLGLPALALVLWARRHMGVRIVRVAPGADALQLFFANTQYAEAFRRANAGVSKPHLLTAQTQQRRQRLGLLLLLALLLVLALLAARLWLR